MEITKSKIVALAGKITDRVRTELEEAAAGGKTQGIGDRQIMY